MCSIKELNNNFNPQFHPIDNSQNNQDMSLPPNQIFGNFSQVLSRSSEEKNSIKEPVENIGSRTDKHSYLKEYLSNHRKGLAKNSKNGLKNFNQEAQTMLELSNGDYLKIHVDGIPSTGAKSRVETQMKLSIHLLDANGSKVPNWSYLRIDHSQLARSKLRKDQNQKLLDESLITMSSDESRVLSLEAQVICESNENKIVKMCQGCVRRELKRSKRKKNAKQEVNKYTNSDSTVTEEVFELDRLRILLFNSDALVNISSGEAVIPTRITCYCRHHNERIGFRIRFAMRNSNGIIVARGQSPVIMITDDHKSSKQRAIERKKRASKYEIPSKDENIVSLCTPQTDSYFNDFTPSDTPFSSHCEDNLGYFTRSRRQSVTSSSSSALHHYASPLLTPSEDSVYLGTPNLYTPTYPVQEMPIQYQEPQYATENILEITRQPSVSAELPYSILHTDIENTSSPSYTNSSCTHTYSLPLPLDSMNQSLVHSSSIINSIYNPKIQALSPSQGPTYGGTEITVIGSGFHADLKVIFGGRSATTVCWNPVSIVCILPPTENPGPVTVLLKGQQLLESENRMFNYYNNNRQEILDISLQAAGNKNDSNTQGNVVFESNISSSLIRNNTLIQQQGIQNKVQFQDQQFEQGILNILSRVYNPSKLEQTNISGQNILHLAGYANYSSLITFIIDRHPTLIDTQDINGFSPLHFACQSKAIDAIQILLRSGANVSLESNFGSPTDLVYEHNPLYSKGRFDSATCERAQEMFVSTPWVPNTFAATQCYHCI